MHGWRRAVLDWLSVTDANVFTFAKNVATNVGSRVGMPGKLVPSSVMIGGLLWLGGSTVGFLIFRHGDGSVPTAIVLYFAFSKFLIRGLIAALGRLLDPSNRQRCQSRIEAQRAWANCLALCLYPALIIIVPWHSLPVVYLHFGALISLLGAAWFAMIDRTEPPRRRRKRHVRRATYWTWLSRLRLPEVS